MLHPVKDGPPVRQGAADVQMPNRSIYIRLGQDHIDAGLEPRLAAAGHAGLAASRRRIARVETEPAVTQRAIQPMQQAVPQNGSKRSR
ncbi:hypothetical protein [Actinomadura rugatobispora]|uniref:Uncharacterized protein n=1 Tax=Actinomadura rugatobispora TaxID=1994 RepID=A0ABW1A6H8_9ACTN|nr:hypothetical protein GCM10010200_020680 [Actinomadura rugatobispora]